MTAGKMNLNLTKQASKFLGQDIPAMDNVGLKQFGLVFAAIVSALFGLILPFLFGFDYPLWPWVVAAIFTLTALAMPRWLRPFYNLWMRFGVIMNIIMSRLILGTVFVLTVVPAGLIFRIRGKDILGLKLDSESPTYRNKINDNHTNDLRKPY